MKKYIAGFLLAAAFVVAVRTHAATTQHLLYVANPGTRDYVDYGGVGIAVFDIDNGYKFVRRITTWEVPANKTPENVKGIAANEKTGAVYVSGLTRTVAIDAVSGKRLWDKGYENGTDRLAASPDGKTLYIPEFEGPAWHVVDAATGDIRSTVTLNSGSHNTIASADGNYVYMAGLKSPLLSVLDAKTDKVVSTVGPFGDVIRPFTVNGKNTLVFVNINNLLGFEVGDIKTGKKLYRVEVQGYKPGVVKRHGCPSHGIALTQDEKELWIADCANEMIHIFNATVMPPKQIASIPTRDCSGWISSSMDGKQMYSASGEIFDTKTRKVIATLRDEVGHHVMSEKQVEVIIADGKLIKAGNQFGVGGVK